MIWVAFGTGIILGVFSGMLLLGLVKELAVSRRKPHSGKPIPVELSVIPAAQESQIAPQPAGRSITDWCQ